MQVPHKKQVVIFSFVLVILGLILTVPGSQNISQNISGEDSGVGTLVDVDQKVEEVIVEGEPVFVTSSTIDDYVDSTQIIEYGSHSSGPPSGMGQDSTSDTELTEEYYSGTNWDNKMTQTTFSGTPAGWTVSTTGISYSNGDFMNSFGATNGYLYCSPVSTTGYDTVRFTLSSSYYRQGEGAYYVSFYSSSLTWVKIDDFTLGSKVDQVFSSSNSEFKHAGFRVRIDYSSFGGLGFDSFLADNWRIEAGDNYYGHRLDITYKFSGVNWNQYPIEEFNVDFDIISSLEDLDFILEAGDSTPDEYAINGVHTDINDVDISGILDDDEFYVRITDVIRSGDGDADTWRINRMYIRLSNNEPVNDQAPICTNLDDSNHLYARNKLYEFSCSVADADGYAHLDYLELRSYDTGTSNLRWSVRFDEDTHSFTETAGQSIITLMPGSYWFGGNNLDVVFKLYIEWEHPDAASDDLYQYVRDASGEYDADSYNVNYNYETRLNLASSALDDGAGTPDRGNINGILGASGTITYYNSALHPPSDEVDVWVSAPLNSGDGPWSDTTLVSGNFGMTVYPDDVVGEDDYTYKAVKEGAGSSGASLFYTTFSDSYISDQVVVSSYDCLDPRVAIGTSVLCTVSLIYDYDDTFVTDGSVTTNGISTNYTETNGDWEFYSTSSIVEEVVYSNTQASGNEHGVTAENQNSQTLSVIYDRVIVAGYSTTDYRQNIGSAVSITVTLQYEYDSDYLAAGTIRINGIDATYTSAGQYYITTSESSVTDVTYDTVTVIGAQYDVRVVNHDSQEITIIWDSVSVTMTDPGNQRINLNENASGIVVSGTYDYDGQPFDGVFALNNSVFSYDSMGRRDYTVSLLSGDTYAITLISSNDVTYCAWDGLVVSFTDPTDSRINVGDTATGISASAVYGYDGASFDGTLTLNSSTFSYGSVGRRGYTVTSASGGSLGITAIASNDDTSCIWDVVDVVTLDSTTWNQIDELFLVWCTLELRYDGHQFGAGDTVIIADQTAVWNGTHFIVEISYPTTGDREFIVNSTSEATYSISVLNAGIACLVHITDSPVINDISSDFEAIDDLYQGVYSGVNLWIHWDPFNDPTPPDFNFTIEGAYITAWNVTSSWSGLEVLSGTENGTFTCSLESGLPYSLLNHTYTVWVGNTEGHEYSITVYILVTDYIVPTINEPSNVIVTEGSSGVSIIWIGSDTYPDRYEITRNGTPIASGVWNSSAESFTVSLNGLAMGEYVFIITLYDEVGNPIQDTVIVTVEAASVTTTTTTEPTTTTTTTNTTLTPGDGTILTITIVITIAGVVIVIVVIIIKRK